MMSSAKNEKIANDVRSGKQAAAGPLIGQIMKQLKGADAKKVRELLYYKSYQNRETKKPSLASNGN